MIRWASEQWNWGIIFQSDIYSSNIVVPKQSTGSHVGVPTKPILTDFNSLYATDNYFS